MWSAWALGLQEHMDMFGFSKMPKLSGWVCMLTFYIWKCKMCTQLQDMLTRSWMEMEIVVVWHSECHREESVCPNIRCPYKVSFTKVHTNLHTFNRNQPVAWSFFITLYFRKYCTNMGQMKWGIKQRAATWGCKTKQEINKRRDSSYRKGQKQRAQKELLLRT